MKIKNIVEKEDGSVVFQGTLVGPELAFVVEYGLNRLLVEGALPFVTKTSTTAASLMDLPESTQ
jgi:hypothetical protein